MPHLKRLTNWHAYFSDIANKVRSAMEEIRICCNVVVVIFAFVCPILKRKSFQLLPVIFVACIQIFKWEASIYEEQGKDEVIDMRKY